MAKKISEELKQKAIKLYKNTQTTIQEISNLVNISIPHLTKIYRKAFNDGILTPRMPQIALKHRPAKGEGKGRYVPTGVGQGGRSKEYKKYTEEQEREIVIDYYERDLSVRQLKEKWDIHPKQLQRLRNQYGAIYGQKSRKPKKYKDL